jgi:hypothetical protein
MGMLVLVLGMVLVMSMRIDIRWSLHQSIERIPTLTRRRGLTDHIRWPLCVGMLMVRGWMIIRRKTNRYRTELTIAFRSRLMLRLRLRLTCRSGPGRHLGRLEG